MDKIQIVISSMPDKTETLKFAKDVKVFTKHGGHFQKKPEILWQMMLYLTKKIKKIN